LQITFTIADHIHDRGREGVGIRLGLEFRCVCVFVCVCTCVRASERACLPEGGPGAFFVAGPVVNGDRCKRGSRHVGAHEADKSRACQTATRRQGVDQIDRGRLTFSYVRFGLFLFLGIFFLGRFFLFTLFVKKLIFEVVDRVMIHKRTNFSQIWLQQVREESRVFLEFCYILATC
jgi:hypothetical protein